MKIELKSKNNIDPKTRKIVFKHDRCIGDALMFTAGLRDFKLLFPDILVNVESNHNFLWENNPYLERGLHKNQNGVEFYEVGYPAVGNANNAALHFSTMFLLDMIAAADLHQPLPISLGEFCASFANGSVGDPPLGNLEKNKDAREPFISLREKYKEHCKEFARQRGDIHMSSEEKENNLIERQFGIHEYWVIAPGGKWDFTAKFWDWRKFQDVIDHFENKIKFIIVGKSEHRQFNLKGAIDLIDYFNDDIRGLLPLVYHSTGTVCVPSFLMHLTAAIPSKFHKERKPCVSIFGGREPTTWSWYCNHQILHTNGAQSCCQAGGCWRARTEKIDKDKKHNNSICYRIVDVEGEKIQTCMNSITSEDVIRAIEKYYEGDMYQYEDGTNGRLSLDLKVGLRQQEAHPPQEIEDEIDPRIWKETDDGRIQLDDGMDTIVDIKDEFKPLLFCNDDKKQEPIKEDTEYLPTSDVVIGAGDEKKNCCGNCNDECKNHNEDKKIPKEKTISLLGNLNTDGGGEQSLCTIGDLLTKAGWQVNLYPWGSVSDKLSAVHKPYSFEDNILESRHIDGRPLLFYANDKSWDFVKNEKAKELINRCSGLVIGINYVIGGLQRCDWLNDSGKLKAVIFQNREKQSEWEKEVVGFDNTKLITLYGAIDLDRYLKVEPRGRASNDDLVVLKHCKADKRKYVTTESMGGDKRHLWQKYMAKDLDTKFYTRLLKNVKRARFEFMEAPSELVNYFRGEKRMVFHKWNAMPVDEFLSRGHVFLYRTSNRWRDQYPRVMAEALASGLPVLTEPRDGTADRVVHGDTGFHCIDFDGFQYALKLLQRKETFRFAMAKNAKQWAKDNLNPQRWVEILEDLLL